MARGVWAYAGGKLGRKPSPAEKREITQACEQLIAEFLIPTFLPEIKRDTFNYPVAIYGKWHGNKYRFITRYRSDRPTSTMPEFDVPFARLDYVSKDRFDFSYMRHTDQWQCLFQYITLAEALQVIKDGEFVHVC